MPAQVKVLEKVGDVYRPSKHLMLEVTLEEAGSSHLLSAVTVSTEFKVVIFTSESETVFDVQL